MIKAGAAELKAHRADLTDKQAKNVLLMNLEIQQMFPGIIVLEDVKEILEFALKYPLNNDYLKQLQERLIELGDINVLCDFAIEFQDRINTDIIAQKLVSAKKIFLQKMQKRILL